MEDLGGAYPYEHTTMPGWAGSSWYFLRYMDPKNDKEFVSKQLTDYWQSVDLYIGGSEHATGHLLYVRFWTKFLKDLGFLTIEEPMKKLINQGMIQGRSNFVYRTVNPIFTTTNGLDYTKIPAIFISKGIADKIESKDSNVLNEIRSKITELIQKPFLPEKVIFSFEEIKIGKFHVDINLVENDQLNIDKYVEATTKYNKDYTLEFITEQGKYICGWEIEKMSKSKLNVQTPDDICEKFGADTLRLYEMFLGPLEQSKPWNTNGITGVAGFLKKLWRLFYAGGSFAATDAEPTKAELKTLHKTIKKITEDIERFSFNTSVSNFMICVNELGDQKCNKRAILEPLLICLSPYAPHITEELWHQLGHTESITFAPFPLCNEAYLVEDSFNYPISFNGKMRFNIELPATLTVPEIEKEVMNLEEVQKHLNGASPKKIIIVPKKIVNIVV